MREKVLQCLLFAVCLPVIFFSCQKSGVSGNPPIINPGGSSYVSSIRLYNPQRQLVDSFRYDSSHHLVEWAQYLYDTTSGTPQSDSQFIRFSFAANATVPGTYGITYGSYTDVHQLYFDGQQRIVKDTSLSGTHMVAYYSYPGGNIATTVLFEGTLSDNQIDTLLLKDGNISEERVYYPNDAGTADSLSGDILYGYAAYANPAYQPAIANTIGPLLNILSIDGAGGYSDHVSKNIVSQLSGVADGLPANAVIQFTMQADNAGRVVEYGYGNGQGYARFVFSYY